MTHRQGDHAEGPAKADNQTQHFHQRASQAAKKKDEEPQLADQG